MVIDAFYLFINMNYLAQMLRDCSKNRSSTFTEISFPIIQEIQNKIKHKNGLLRKKMKQRLSDSQKNSRIQDKKEDPSAICKKEPVIQKVQREIVNYIEAYEDQKPQQPKTYGFQLQDVRLDERQSENTFLIYLLMRKRKTIFKIEQVRRKLRSKQYPKRMSLKQCDCCQRVGKHKCLHKFCEGKCEKLRNRVESVKNASAESIDEDLEAIHMAQQIVEDKIKQEDMQFSVVRITHKEDEALIIPNIDITDREQVKEENQVSVHDRERISENESNSDLSRNKIGGQKIEVQQIAVEKQEGGQVQQIRQIKNKSDFQIIEELKNQEDVQKYNNDKKSQTKGVFSFSNFQSQQKDSTINKEARKQMEEYNIPQEDINKEYENINKQVQNKLIQMKQEMKEKQQGKADHFLDVLLLQLVQPQSQPEYINAEIGEQ